MSVILCQNVKPLLLALQKLSGVRCRAGILVGTTGRCCCCCRCCYLAAVGDVMRERVFLSVCVEAFKCQLSREKVYREETHLVNNLNKSYDFILSELSSTQFFSKYLPRIQGKNSQFLEYYSSEKTFLKQLSIKIRKKEVL